jgi:phosphate uptake regulator
MEARKVQITGKSTYMITLPKKWAVDVGLQPGSLISITYRDNGSLLLTPPSNKPFVSRKILQLDSLNAELRKELIGAYVMGHQFIELHGEKIPLEARSEVKAVCKRLIGTEIVEETEKKIVIYDILNPGEYTLEKGLKRMFALVSSMLKSLIDVFHTQGDQAMLTDIASQEEEVDRVFLLIVKLFTKRLKEGWISKEDQLDLVEAFHYRLAAEHLERIADHTVKIARKLTSFDFEALPPEIASRFAEVGKDSLERVERSVNSLRRKNVEQANAILNEHEKVKERIAEINRLTITTAYALPLDIVIDSMRRIGDYASNIAELAIDLSQL